MKKLLLLSLALILLGGCGAKEEDSLYLLDFESEAGNIDNFTVMTFTEGHFDGYTDKEIQSYLWGMCNGNSMFYDSECPCQLNIIINYGEYENNPQTFTRYYNSRDQFSTEDDCFDFNGKNYCFIKFNK
jgi:hypothetical protein